MKNNKAIRILQVGMSPFYGGTEAFIMNQYRFIDRSKVQFDFLNVYSEKIACQDEIESLGGQIYHLDMARHNGINDYFRRIDVFFRNYANRFDVVHCNFQSLINTDILRYAKKYGIKVLIAHAHNSGYGIKPNIRQKLLINLNRLMLDRFATHYFACSELAAKWMFGHSATIIKNTINTDKYVYSEETRKIKRSQLGLNENYVAIFVGRLDPQKNPMFLLEIFSELKVIKPNAKLLVIGDGILRQDMEKRIFDLRIGNSVEMLGSCDNVNELLQAADVFLLPSKFEGLGIVLIESQAAGLPTFTSEDVVPPEAKITDLLTFVSLRESPKQWAQKIALCEGIERKNMKKQICCAGYDNVVNAKKLEELYLNSVLNK